jgi:uncharacterized membrane protein
VRFVLHLAAALGAGLIAGVFFAFSAFVRKALVRLPAREGIAAMKSINVAVINSVFLGVFLGTAAICVAAPAGVAMRAEAPGGAYVWIGAALYLVGTFLVTIRCNVPLNNSLAALAPDDPDAGKRWAGYVRRWTVWNTVRTAAARAAAAAFSLALGQ